jgi:hypothetical protein
MSNRILYAILCASLALLPDRACCDFVDPMAVLEAYEKAVTQYWENTEMSSSASFSKVNVTGTLFLAKEQVYLVVDTQARDKRESDRRTHIIGSAERLLLIDDGDITGNNPEDWFIRSSLDPPKDARLRPAGMFWASALLGVFAASTKEEVTTIPRLLREADELTAGLEEVDGIEVIALNAVHSRGTIEVLLIPSKGHVLYRLNYTASDPKPGMLRCHAVQFSDYSLMNGLWVPRFETKTVHGIPPDANPDSIADRSSDKIMTINIEIEPFRRLGNTETADLVEEVLNRVPDGTRVRMNDSPHADFEWQNGEPVLVGP